MEVSFPVDCVMLSDKERCFFVCFSPSCHRCLLNRLSIPPAALCVSSPNSRRKAGCLKCTFAYLCQALVNYFIHIQRMVTAYKRHHCRSPLNIVGRRSEIKYQHTATVITWNGSLLPLEQNRSPTNQQPEAPFLLFPSLIPRCRLAVNSDKIIVLSDVKPGRSQKVGLLVGFRYTDSLDDEAAELGLFSSVFPQLVDADKIRLYNTPYLRVRRSNVVYQIDQHL